MSSPLGGPRDAILIDGGSGSGKTQLAHQLAASLRADGRRAQVISLDSFYPGWSGLAAASTMVVTEVFPNARYQRWNWDARQPADWVALDPDSIWIVEGCGALTPASRPFAATALWLEAPAGVRKDRALARDGDTFAPWWDHWAAQERAHWAAHQPWTLADVVVRR